MWHKNFYIYVFLLDSEEKKIIVKKKMAKIERKKKKSCVAVNIVGKGVEISFFVHSPIFLSLSPFSEDDIFCAGLTDLWVSQTWDPNVNERDACRTYMSMREMLYKIGVYENFSFINFCGLGWKHSRTHFSPSFYRVKHVIPSLVFYLSTLSTKPNWHQYFPCVKIEEP